MQQKNVFKRLTHEDPSFSFSLYPGLIIIFKSSSQKWDGFYKEKINQKTIRKEIEDLIKSSFEENPLIYDNAVILIGQQSLLQMLIFFFRGRGFSHIQYQYRENSFIIRKKEGSRNLEISKDKNATWQTDTYEKFELKSKGFTILGACSKEDIRSKIEKYFVFSEIKLLNICDTDQQIRTYIADHIIDAMIIEASFATSKPYLIKNIIHHYKIPVLIVFSIQYSPVAEIFELLRMGAFDYVSLDKENDSIIAKIVTDKLKFSFEQTIKSEDITVKSVTIEEKEKGKLKNKTIGIGASTGGPVAIKTILSAIKKPHPPIIIAQHILPAYAESFAKWIELETHLSTNLAKAKQVLEINQVYVLPADTYLHIEEENEELKFAPFKAEEKRLFTPCIDDLFWSMSICAPHVGAVILLTGMGTDGAKGLLSCKEAGIPTFVQDEETSTIFGMPKEAIAIGAADRVLPIDQMMFEVIQKITNKK